jgi:hypothetical protein
MKHKLNGLIYTFKDSETPGEYCGYVERVEGDTYGALWIGDFKSKDAVDKFIDSLPTD